MKAPTYDKSIHACKACCEFGLCNYKEAREECEKAPESDLKVLCAGCYPGRTDSCCTWLKNWGTRRL